LSNREKVLKREAMPEDTEHVVEGLAPDDLPPIVGATDNPRRRPLLLEHMIHLFGNLFSVRNLS
jgi:hypothetical protein